MELEIYEAFRSAGVADDKAKAAVESINREIDKRYALHSDQLATRGDLEIVRRELADAKAEIIKWIMATMIAAIGICIAVLKMMPA